MPGLLAEARGAGALGDIEAIDGSVTVGVGAGIRRLAPRLAEVGTTDDMLGLLDEY